MIEIYRLLSIQGQTTSPYHAQANGLVERFNGTLKQMLRRLCKEKPREWDRFIPAVLFAYREIPQESMKFSPFELLYGRTVRGPTAILKQLWTNEEFDPEIREECAHVIELRNRVADTCELAHQHLRSAASKYKKVYDRKAKERWFEPGDEVLLLLPQKRNKLQIEWQGPFKVTQRIGSWDYRIEVRGKTRLYHANLLKRYHRREQCCAGFTPVVVEEGSLELDATVHDIPTVPLNSEETWTDVELAPRLSDAQRQQASRLCEEFQDILTDIPLRCNIGVCTLPLSEDNPVRVKQYPLPHSQAEQIRKEVSEMLEMGVIEKASSPYSAPILLVKKKGGKMRFCVDFRRLNKVLYFDAEPMPDVSQIFAGLSGACFFSKLDLAKGYWQIPMDGKDKHKTAFTTPEGQFQWTVMPFGLKTAGAIFSRIMREVLAPLSLREIQNFMDDLLISTTTWERHLIVLRRVFRRLREVQLAARPTKCQLGKQQISFLGHCLEQGNIRPEEDKVEKIATAKTPTTKKELRSFLGLAGYYRKFVPNFAEIALPLTGKTKGRHPNRLQWDSECQKAFETLKRALTTEPILLLVDPTQPMTLRTDASATGLGAVLLQDHGAGLQPVAYASKKLSEAESRYHTIEQECLAVVWGIRKFYPYLYGRTFTLQSDHHPLQYLDRIRPVSRRLMGWAIELQSYSFSFQHISGVSNVEADFLSRMTH